MKSDNGVTMQAWDIAKSISMVLPFKGEVVMNWNEGYYYGYGHSYALIFQNKL